MHKKGIKKSWIERLIRFFLFFLFFSSFLFSFLFYSSISILRKFPPFVPAMIETNSPNFIKDELCPSFLLSSLYFRALQFFFIIFFFNSFQKERHAEQLKIPLPSTGHRCFHTTTFTFAPYHRVYNLDTKEFNSLPFSPDSRFNRLTRIEFLSKDKIYRPTLGSILPLFLLFSNRSKVNTRE